MLLNNAEGLLLNNDQHITAKQKCMGTSPSSDSASVTVIRWVDWMVSSLKYSSVLEWEESQAMQPGGEIHPIETMFFLRLPVSCFHVVFTTLGISKMHLLPLPMVPTWCE